MLEDTHAVQLGMPNNNYNRTTTTTTTTEQQQQQHNDNTKAKNGHKREDEKPISLCSPPLRRIR